MHKIKWPTRLPAFLKCVAEWNRAENHDGLCGWFGVFVGVILGGRGSGEFFIFS